MRGVTPVGNNPLKHTFHIQQYDFILEPQYAKAKCYQPSLTTHVAFLATVLQWAVDLNN